MLRLLGVGGQEVGQSSGSLQAQPWQSSASLLVALEVPPALGICTVVQIYGGKWPQGLGQFTAHRWIPTCP